MLQADDDLPQWTRYLDDQSNYHYYVNNITGESFWEGEEGAPTKEIYEMNNTETTELIPQKKSKKKNSKSKSDPLSKNKSTELRRRKDRNNNNNNNVGIDEEQSARLLAAAIEDISDDDDLYPQASSSIFTQYGRVLGKFI